MRRAVLVLTLLTLAACSTSPPPQPAPAPPLVSAAPPPISRPPADLPSDACRAQEFQSYVGRKRSEIPVPIRPELQRVACTTCPVTMDFNPNRLNFFFDAATGVIKEVRCG